jgi:hypothetical protein
MQPMETTILHIKESDIVRAQGSGIDVDFSRTEQNLELDFEVVSEPFGCQKSELCSDHEKKQLHQLKISLRSRSLGRE